MLIWVSLGVFVLGLRLLSIVALMLDKVVKFLFCRLFRVVVVGEPYAEPLFEWCC